MKFKRVIVYSPSICRMSNFFKHSSSLRARGDDSGLGSVACSVADIFYTKLQRLVKINEKGISLLSGHELWI